MGGGRAGCVEACLDMSPARGGKRDVCRRIHLENSGTVNYHGACSAFFKVVERNTMGVETGEGGLFCLVEVGFLKANYIMVVSEGLNKSGHLVPSCKKVVARGVVGQAPHVEGSNRGAKGGSISNPVVVGVSP